jgi:hypothetical protein
VTFEQSYTLDKAAAVAQVAGLPLISLRRGVYEQCNDMPCHRLLAIAACYSRIMSHVSRRKGDATCALASFVTTKSSAALRCDDWAIHSAT